MPRRSHHRIASALQSLATFAVLASTGCGGTTSEPKTDPMEAIKPARVVVVSSPPSSGEANTTVGDFVVRVEDAQGRGLANVPITFTWSPGTGGGGGFAPQDTTTDATGLARTTIHLGTLAGPGIAQAAVSDPARMVSVSITITPAAPARLLLDGFPAQLYGAGDEATFRAVVIDRYLNLVPSAGFVFAVADSTLLSVEAPVTPGGEGRVRALRGGDSTTVTATAAGLAQPIAVHVRELSRTPCTGALSAQDVDFGNLVTVADTTICLAAKTTRASYGLIVYNSSTDGATSIGTTVTGYNIEQNPLILSRVPPGTRPLASRSPALRRRGNVPTRDLHFHTRLLVRGRAMAPLFARARAARVGTTAIGRVAASRAAYALGAGTPAVPAVDDLLSLNVASDPCTVADMRTFRVEAVGDKSIVLADTANPTGGFSRTDYARFAARFDTLVYPLDAGSFGDPSDIDGNGRVAILFTRAVNELTPPNAGAYVGGFFHPRDLFPRQQSSVDVCPTSNEGELFYMMVPDPAGTVNGNQFSSGFVDTLTTGVLAHEFQHLINASRRLYVNTSAQSFEDVWLNEGLSHIAEELLYFRESGFTPRSHLTSQSITDSWAHWTAWASDDASNFVRFYLYLLDPKNNSPLDAGDALETRGATWAFLRFAVDQTFSSDAGVWQRFGNSTTTGLGTLDFGLQRDPTPLLRDFALANYGALSDARYMHQSWNFPDVYSQLFVARSYPRQIGQLQDEAPVAVTARGASASYYEFVVEPGFQALLKFGTSQAPPDGKLSLMLLRN
jgi:hypothetical protein